MRFVNYFVSFLNFWIYLEPIIIVIYAKKTIIVSQIYAETLPLVWTSFISILAAATGSELGLFASLAFDWVPLSACM